jgi:hypothetical protein
MEESPGERFVPANSLTELFARELQQVGPRDSAIVDSVARQMVQLNYLADREQAREFSGNPNPESHATHSAIMWGQLISGRQVAPHDVPALFRNAVWRVSLYTQSELDEIIAEFDAHADEWERRIDTLLQG